MLKDVGACWSMLKHVDCHFPHLPAHLAPHPGRLLVLGRPQRHPLPLPPLVTTRSGPTEGTNQMRGE
eukprot:2761217-Pyramimonas_sp.AAC.1